MNKRGEGKKVEERGRETREMERGRAEGRKMERRNREMSFGDDPHNLSPTSMAER